MTVAAGASETVTVPLEARCLEVFSTAKNGWEQPGGEYKVEVGGSSSELPLQGMVTLAAQ